MRTNYLYSEFFISNDYVLKNIFRNHQKCRYKFIQLYGFHTSSSSSSSSRNDCTELSVTLVIRLYCLSLLVGLLDCIQCLLKADLHKSLMVGQYWHVHMWECMKERRLLVRLYLSASTQHVLFVLLGWLV